MLNHKGFIIRVVIFCAIIFLIFQQINYVLIPKFYYNNDWPTTACYKGFYQMQRNSVDVLFFGSSHAVSSFNPQVLYESYGITSYNLACEQQNMLTTYYWLKEALRFQKPQVVIADIYMLFEYERYEPLNTLESCTRKAFDSMRWSKVKWEAVHDICKYDENQTLASYYFPNVRYHTRWTSLSEDDFAYSRMEKHYEMKGFSPFSRIEVHNEYMPYDSNDSMDFSDTVPLMQEYLDRIVKLCEEEGITLVLVKTPTTRFDCNKHNTVLQYAEEHGINFWDFNEQTVYNACNFVFTEDMSDIAHSNIWGAEKITLFLGEILSDKLGVERGANCKLWDKTSQYYKNILHDCMLPHITDIYEYIDAIKQNRYTILISIYNDASIFLSDELTNKFRELGLAFELEENDSYCAVLSEGKIYEERAQEQLTFYGSTRNKLLDYKVVSTGGGIGEGSYIAIGNVQYAKNRNGINIVIYNNETMRVIDVINFSGSLNR